jgi:uncharacterized protein DUF6950
MKRLIDWPDRLAAALEISADLSWTEERYCVLWAADVVLAMTGEDPAAGYRGLSVEQAYRAMRDAGHETIGGAIAAVVGPQVPLAFARRGDVVLRADETAVGICVGEYTAFLSDTAGLALYPTLEQAAAYRVPG